MSLLPFHILAGIIGLASGFLALFALKGAKLHRASGRFFVYAMLVMSLSGAVIAVIPHRNLAGEQLQPNWGTALGGFLAAYLVVTGLLTLRRRVGEPRWIDLGALLVAPTLGATYVTFGLEALSSATGKKDGYPPALFFIFGAVTLLAALGDIRVLARGIQETQRLARHLWRMCFAMFIAAGSFFLGQAKLFPKPIRILPVLAIPVLLVLVLMFYWLARVLLTRRHSRTPQALAANAPAAR